MGFCKRKTQAQLTGQVILWSAPDSWYRYKLQLQTTQNLSTLLQHHFSTLYTLKHSDKSSCYMHSM